MEVADNGYRGFREIGRGAIEKLEKEALLIDVALWVLIESLEMYGCVSRLLEIYKFFPYGLPAGGRYAQYFGENLRKLFTC